MLRAGDVAAVSEAVVAHTQRADAELKAKHASDAWITVKQVPDLTCEKLSVAALAALGIKTKAEAFRLTARVKMPVDACHKLLVDYENRKQWDPTVAAGSESAIEVGMSPEGQQFNLLRTLTNPAFGGVVSPREFLDVAMTTTAEDGVVRHVAASVTHELFPPAKGFVRGFNHACGFIFTPVEEQTATEVTYIVNADIGGWLPASVVNKASISTLMDVLSTLMRQPAPV